MNIVNIVETTRSITGREKLSSEIDELIISERRMPLSICMNAFKGKTIKTLRIRGDIGSIEHNAFGNVGLESIIFEGGDIVEIDDKAFASNKLPQSVIDEVLAHTIGICADNAFDNQFVNFGTKTGLKGKSFVITGSMSMGTRDIVERYIESYGGTVESRVTASTDYLVTNSTKPTTKMKAALKHGTTIIDEKELIAMASA